MKNMTDDVIFPKNFLGFQIFKKQGGAVSAGQLAGIPLISGNNCFDIFSTNDTFCLFEVFENMLIFMRVLT